MADRRSPPEECANCGAAIPRTAKACPECGADELTGWRDSSIYDGLDLPSEAFEEKTSAGRRSPRPAARVNGVAWYWWLVGVLVLVLLVLGAFGLR